MGSTHVKTAFFKLYLAAAYSMFSYINLNTIGKFVQVVVWKRVMEINEELASRCLNVSVISINLFLGLLCHPEYKQYAIISVFSDKMGDVFFST